VVLQGILGCSLGAFRSKTKAPVGQRDGSRPHLMQGMHKSSSKAVMKLHITRLAGDQPGAATRLEKDDPGTTEHLAGCSPLSLFEDFWG